MIEAVNSVLQTAPFVRASNEQISTSDSLAANPDRIQKAPQAPFISPFIHVDVNFDKAVIQLRNGDTGDVEDQFPSQASLEAQARSNARRQVASENAPEPQESVRQSSGNSEPSAPAPTNEAVITQQQQQAFQAAAQSGNSNAGNVTLFA